MSSAEGAMGGVREHGARERNLVSQDPKCSIWIVSYQSGGVGTVNTEESDRRAGFLGRGSIAAQTVESHTGSGELLGGTQARAGDTGGHHLVFE